MGPNGDIFTPTFLGSLCLIPVTLFLIAGGIWWFLKNNTFISDQSVREKLAAVEPSEDEWEDYKAKALAIWHGSWHAVKKSAGLLFKSQIPALATGVSAICLFLIAVVDLLV